MFRGNCAHLPPRLRVPGCHILSLPSTDFVPGLYEFFIRGIHTNKKWEVDPEEKDLYHSGMRQAPNGNFHYLEVFLSFVELLKHVCKSIESCISSHSFSFSCQSPRLSLLSCTSTQDGTTSTNSPSTSISDDEMRNIQGLISSSPRLT